MRRLFLLAIWLCCLAETTLAQCSGTVMLSRFHQEYRATLTESDDAQRSAAQALLVIAGGNAATLTRQVAKSGIDIEPERLTLALSNGAKLAKQVLARDPLPADLNPNESDVSWLAERLNSNSCSGATTASGTSLAAGNGHSAFGNGRSDSNSSSALNSANLAALGAVLALIGAIIGVVLYRRSWTHQKRVTVRLPRRQVHHTIQIMFTDGDGNMKQTDVAVLDLSVSGAKLEWPDNNAPAKSAVTAMFPFGNSLATVVWSNTHYAGIMFDERISDADIKEIEELSDPKK